VFLPFHRLASSLPSAAGDGKGRGAGLGLALVRQIARIHGGEAVATAWSNARSCILVTLPTGSG
jgi:signal transduction histidine kinase